MHKASCAKFTKSLQNNVFIFDLLIKKLYMFVYLYSQLRKFYQELAD